MGSLLPDGFLRAAPTDLLDAEETRYERDLKTALEESMRFDEVERDPDVYLAVQAMARMEAGEEDTDIEVVDEDDDDAASAASLRSDIESAVAVLADEQVRSAARLAELETELRSSSSSRSSTKLREGHAEASEEAAMLARRRDRLERAASELDAMEVALNGSDAPPEERRALREIILHSLLTDLENGGESNAKPKPKPPSGHDTKDKAPATATTGGGIVSRLLGRRKIAVVEDDEESTFANPNDLGRASGLSDDFSVLDDDPNDLARMSGMSELARASGSLGLTRGPRGVDEMELLLGDIKKMAAKMRSKNQRRNRRRGDETDEDVRSELALFDDLRHTLLDRDDTNKRKPPDTASSHELTRTSSALGRLERERKAFGPLLRDLAEEVRDARPADPEALREFLDKIDEVLASLTEPHAILREIPEWPGAKVEAMRELRDLQTELREMAGAMNEWPALDPNSRALRRTAKASAVMWACDEELGKIARAMDAAARRLESITRRLESDGKRFEAHGLTFDEADVEKTRHASLTLAERHMRCASLAADRAMDDGDADGVGKARELLAGAVRFAFRSHELAGGFNAGCRDALEDVRNALNSFPDRR